MLKCNSTKLIKIKNKINLDSSVVNLLNGKYLNNSTDTTFLKTYFWQHLHKNKYKLNDSIYINKDNFFELTIIDKSTLNLKLLYSNMKILSFIKYNYTIKNGIILIKRHQNKLIEGIPIFFYRKTYETLNLTLDNNKDLLLGCDGSIFSAIFAFKFGISTKVSYLFRRQ